MRRTLIGLWFLVMLVLPATAQNTKKKPDADVDKDQAKAVSDSKKKLVAAGKVAGKLTQVEGSQKYLTVQVTTKLAAPNASAQQQMLNLQRQIAEAQLDRNPANRARRLADLQVQMARQQANMVQYKDHHYNVELQAADNMKVRTLSLPVEYDDKGKPRKYTAKELSDLKGSDPKLLGYTAEFDNLRVGQEVEVTVLRPKTTTTAKPKPKDKDRDLVAEEDRLQATLIVILRDPPPK
jgi:hypothetical protein